jgi:hypothetical protein
MKSKVAKQLIDWLNDNVSIIDLPRTYTIQEAKRIIDVVEDELIGLNTNKKVNDFKKNWYSDCDIKSEKVKNKIENIKSSYGEYDDIMISENMLIELIEITENE